MPKVKVLLPISVPDGRYCWEYSESCVCSHLDNFGGVPTCSLSLGNLEYGEKGVPKGEKCLPLKPEHPSRNEYFDEFYKEVRTQVLKIRNGEVADLKRANQIRDDYMNSLKVVVSLIPTTESATMGIDWKDFKDGVTVYTEEFWYDLTDGGYIKPEELLIDADKAIELRRAIDLVKSFEQSLEELGGKDA